MKKKIIRKATTFILASALFITPLSVNAMILRTGSRGSEVVKIQQELKDLGYFNYHTATGYYGNITTSAVRAYQVANGLLVDGIVGPQTYGSLFGTNLTSASTSQSGKVGALDWWSTVRYIFPRGMNAKVTDLDTGKVFYIKRTFGTNHADVEPLTAQDSKTIKEIWGGWSWVRRAVIVEFGEYKVAASLAAMPHAGVDSQPSEAMLNQRSGGYGRGYNLDGVKNNGADGVMDLHFLNSRTHGTNRVDSQHQNQIARAAAYLKSIQ